MSGDSGRDRPVRGILVVALVVVTGCLAGWSALGPSGGVVLAAALGGAAAVAVFGPGRACSRRRSRR